MRKYSLLNAKPLLGQQLGGLAELVILKPFRLVFLVGINIMAMDGQLLALSILGADNGVSDTAIVLRILTGQQRTAILASALVTIASDRPSALWGIVLIPVLYDGLPEETDDLIFPKGEESLLLGICCRKILWHKLCNLV